MALFSSNNLKVKYDDLRTNVKKIAFGKNGIEVEFNGLFQKDLDDFIENKASKIYEKNVKRFEATHSAFRSFLHSEDDVKLPRMRSEFTFKGDDLLDLVYDINSVEQIAPDAFRLRGKNFNLTDLQDKLYETELEIYNLRRERKNSKNKSEIDEKIEKEEENQEELEKKMATIEKDREEFKKRVKKEDSEALSQLKEMVIYVSPMGLSLNMADAFSNLPEISEPEKKNRKGFSVDKKYPTRINKISLMHPLKDEDGDVNEDLLDYKYEVLSYTTQLPLVIPEDIRSALQLKASLKFDGHFKSGSIRKISDSEFSAVNYITGCEERFYVGAFEITSDPLNAFDKDKLNPSDPNWFMNL